MSSRTEEAAAPAAALFIDQIKARARRVPVKQLDAAVDEAIRTPRVRR